MLYVIKLLSLSFCWKGLRNIAYTVFGVFHLKNVGQFSYSVKNKDFICSASDF